jgi:hypothetical protein
MKEKINSQGVNQNNLYLRRRVQIGHWIHDFIKGAWSSRQHGLILGGPLDELMRV